MARQGDEAPWTKILRVSPQMVVGYVISAIVTAIIAYVSRDVLAGIATATFLGVSIVIWILALLFVGFRLYEPIQMMTERSPNGSNLNLDLERLRIDFMANLGRDVMEDPFRNATQGQERLDSDEAKSKDYQYYSPAKLEAYKMSEETLRSVEILVQSIAKIRKIRSTLPRARLLLSRSNIALAALLPIIVIVSFFTSLLPQTPSTAVSVAFVLPFVVGALVVPAIASFFSGVVNWHKNVVKLTFFKGAALNDPSGLLNSSLEGKVRRAIDIKEDDQIEEGALKNLIREAVELNLK